MYFQLFGRYGIDKIWRDDILPCRTYLRHWYVLTFDILICYQKDLNDPQLAFSLKEMNDPGLSGQKNKLLNRDPHLISRSN